MELEYGRHDTIGHARAILLPGDAVFRAAAALVAEGAMHQKDGQKDHVEISSTWLNPQGKVQASAAAISAR